VEIKLPLGILKSDLKYPKFEDNTYESFELWFVSGNSIGDEWVIPSLKIAGAGRRARMSNPGVTDRYYASSLSGNLFRVGRGPHVKVTHTVYVRKSRLTALQKFIDLREKSAGDAGIVRDRISTRRARTALRRSSYGW
jgi:hypothetical protein